MNHYGLIDLHLHLDGSLSLASVRELAAMQDIEIEKDDAALLRKLQVSPTCRDLNEYLEKFDFPCSLLQTKAAITRSVSNLCAELTEQGLLYAEIRFAPQLHLLQGLDQQQVVEAAIAGLDQEKFKANLILCCMRGNDNHGKNLETVRMAAKYAGRGICAVDLAGAEALFPTEHFQDLFRLAAELGVPYTIHAGEACGPESVYTALSFGAKRLGHGVRSVEDDALVARLAAEGVTLELCPTSNLNTGIFGKIEDYPIRRLMAAGVKVTVNTDNMMVSGATLASELEKLGLAKDEMYILAKNAAESSFASAAVKEWVIRQIEDRFA
ncbi:MAG: adenosine deaminase [Oscillospiraceae bacterium]|nr:adenosine deaminase [Oscillospiraceae bacterium]